MLDLVSSSLKGFTLVEFIARLRPVLVRRQTRVRRLVRRALIGCRGRRRRPQRSGRSPSTKTAPQPAQEPAHKRSSDSESIAASWPTLCQAGIDDNTPGNSPVVEKLNHTADDTCRSIKATRFVPAARRHRQIGQPQVGKPKLDFRRSGARVIRRPGDTAPGCVRPVPS